MAGRLTEPALLAILPPPGRLTLGLACGEGRLARDLRDLGHDVLAVERSPELVRAARKKDKRMEVLRADIARMPMGSAIADLAVCGDLDGHDGALGEIARVLEPGGRLCAAMPAPERLGALSRALEAAGFVIEALRDEPPGRLVLRARRDA